MKRMLVLIVLLFISADMVHAQALSHQFTFKDRFFWGGSFSMRFGTIDFVEIAPFIGCMITPRLSGGGGFLFRYRNDARYNPDLSTSDYGANAFGRFMVFRPLFVQAEYEYLNYEFLNADATKERKGLNSFFGGGGFSQPISRNASFFIMGLYNFTYDSTVAYSPYYDPWKLKLGVAFGF
jgi:hypothetical protein